MSRRGAYRIQSTSNLVGRSASPWGPLFEAPSARYHEVEFAGSTRYPPVAAFHPQESFVVSGYPAARQGHFQSYEPMAPHMPARPPVHLFGHPHPFTPTSTQPIPDAASIDASVGKAVLDLKSSMVVQQPASVSIVAPLQSSSAERNVTQSATLVHESKMEPPSTQAESVPLVVQVSRRATLPTDFVQTSPPSQPATEPKETQQSPTVAPIVTENTDSMQSPARPPDRLSFKSNRPPESPSSLLSDVRLRRLRVGPNGLHLTNMLLDACPEQILKMANLEELDLSGNKLTSLPASISVLSKLKILDLSGNMFSTVPEIGSLPGLVSLNLCLNRLIRFPTEVGRLTRLEELDLKDNQLIELNANVFDAITNLRLLDLKGNLIPAIPSSLGKLLHLQELNVNNNQLCSLPAELSSLTNLLVLEANGNRLTCIPIFLTRMVSLVQLNVDHNAISSIPRELGHMKSLSKLNIINNPLDRQLSEIAKQGTFALLRFLRSNQESAIPPPSDDSVEVLKAKLLEQERLLRETRIKHQGEMLSVQERLKDSEEKVRKESTRADQLSALVKDLEAKLQGDEHRLETEKLKQRIQDLESEKNKLTAEVIEKEKQFQEVSSRRKELLTEAIKKVEDLVKRLQDAEEENRLLVAEKNGLISHMEAQFSQMREGTERDRLESILRNVLDSSHQIRNCVSRMEGVGQQMNAIMYRMEFNDQAASLSCRNVPPPTGEVTLVCIELDSNVLSWDENPKLYSHAIALVNRKLRRNIESHRGYEVFSVGHVNLVAFQSAVSAVRFTITSMDDCSRVVLGDVAEPHQVATWGLEHAQLPAVAIKIGIHTGKPEILHNIVANRYDYLGEDVQLAFLLASVCPSGCILGTSSIAATCEDLGEHEVIYTTLPPCQFAGIQSPVAIARLQHPRHLHHNIASIDPSSSRPSAAQQLMISMRSAQTLYTDLLNDVQTVERTVATLLLATLDVSNNPTMQLPALESLLQSHGQLAATLQQILIGQERLQHHLSVLEGEQLQRVLSERDHIAERLTQLQDFIGSTIHAENRTSEAAHEDLGLAGAQVESDHTDESLSHDGSVASAVEIESLRSLKDDTPHKGSGDATLEAISSMVQKSRSRFRTVDEANTFIKNLEKLLPRDSARIVGSSAKEKQVDKKATASTTSSAAFAAPSARRPRPSSGSFTPTVTSPTASTMRGSSKPPIPRTTQTHK
eukprot:TRINITY_DN716_c0_g2_i3.p1 TRINITY_DN716_c0_g2~~TRINITY_DN716_c0_g2_i3.p1  ORF type:complete len:1206 (-),score=239.19 TRINITY_DN716_c0_g2_i3:2518-6135(-)